MADVLQMYRDAAAFVNPFRFIEGLSAPQEALAEQQNLLCFSLCTLCFVVSTVTGNYSQVDKLWSIAPVLYAVQAAAFRDFESARLNLAAAVIFVWGARMTYNFSRRGGYRFPQIWDGEEDYRWTYVRQMKGFHLPYGLGHLVWAAFNAGFICAFQLYLLWAITWPLVDVVNGPAVVAMDWASAGMFLALLYTEWTADQQQYEFQTEKYRLINAKKELKHPYKRGFIVSGLWAYSRHPNYTCEQSMWIIVNWFCVGGQGGAWWAPLGAIFLCGLFVFSADLSEGISAKKYPLYKKYQETVSIFWPTPGKPGFPKDL